MKHNWTYKKLTDAATINYGTRVVQKRDGGTIYPVYGGGDATFRMDTYNRENCLVVARFAMSPKCTRRVSGKFFLNDSGLTLEAKEGVRQDYLDWHIIALNDEIYRTAKGAAQKNLDVKTFTSLSIGVPSLDEQQAIVRELDGINHLIDLQEEQLREYDRLAQSLFYTTFGDPATNPKGWEMIPLKENVEEMFLGPFGSSLKVSSYVEKVKAYCMVYEQKHAIQGTLDVETHYIDKRKYDSLERFNVKAGDFIMSCRGTIGKLFQLPENAPIGIIHPSLMKIRLLKDGYNATFFKFLLSKVIVNESTNGNCVQMAITAKELGKKLFIDPPLALQQSFAAQIEAIEQQKALVRKSLDDTRTLFAARMQYYFE